MSRRRREKNRLKIVERKLGRERAHGQCWKGENLIEIDPRQTARGYLNTLIHETLHCIFPAMSESTVNRAASKICRVVWERDFRRLKKRRKRCPSSKSSAASSRSLTRKSL